LTLEKPKDLVGGKRVYKEDGLAGYNINKGKLSFPISKILDPNGQAPTLTATDSSKLAVLVGGTIRQLNLVELQRLCGFPETMRIADGVNMYDLYGNMVCPTVVLAILRCLFAEN
jgi:DNA (cytosine-5)-methyltransferase 1